MKANKILICLLILSLLPLGGCWDRRELEEEAFVVSIGIDRAPNGLLEVLFSIAIPNQIVGQGGRGGGEQDSGVQKTSKVVDFVAHSLPEAIGLANATVERRINLTHVRIIAIGEELAKEGLEKVSDSMVRLPELRRSIYLAVIPGKVRTLFDFVDPILEQNVNRYIEDISMLARETGFFPNVSAHIFFRDAISPHQGGILPVYQVNPKVAEELKGERKRQLRPDEQWEADIQAGVNYQAGELNRTGGNPAEFIGAAVFHGFRKVGETNGRETQTLLLMRGDIRRGRDLIPDPADPKETVDVIVTPRTRPRVHVDLSNREKPVISVKLSVEMTIQGISGSTDYTQEEAIHQLEQAAARQLEQRALALIRKAQREWRTDPFHFGRSIRVLFATWQEYSDFPWIDSFQQAEVMVEAEARIRRSGIILHPPRPVTPE